VGSRSAALAIFRPAADQVVAIWPADEAGISAALTALVEISRDGSCAAMHVGSADLDTDGSYRGAAIDRAGALCDLASPGVAMLSSTARARIETDGPLFDLGQHRLADLREPEHVWALGGMPVDPAAVRSLSTTPHNLPVELTSFIGRRDEVAAVGDVLRRARLVTLIGQGGAGKSRLARHAAAALVGEFPGGLWLVELSGLIESEPVVSRVAAAFGVLASPGAPPIASLDDLVTRIGDREILVVLDQCEHIREPCAVVLARLLPTCAGLRVLATSREPLGVPGEHRWAVPPLTAEDARRLFRERASLNVGGAVTPQKDEPEAVARVCAFVEHLPLGIELAAGWTGVLTAHEIAAHLEDRITFLDASPAAGLSRLGAALDWSYEQLRPTERTLLCRLAVFTGGFAPAAAEHVCAGGALGAADVLSGLVALTDRSLVSPQACRSGERRFRLNDMVREFAIARLSDTATGDVVMHRPAVRRSVLFHREGEYWSVGDANQPFRLRDSRGLGYLHALISDAGREVHVLDLVDRGGVVDAPDTGEVLDARARSAYRRRLADLEDEREEARRHHDIARLERLDEEWDALTGALTQALGLGGRVRRTGSTAERARSSVSKAIRAVLERIGEHDPALARHLRATVRTGAFCAYIPDPDWPGQWELEPAPHDLTM
jgi:predicted ATPase